MREFVISRRSDLRLSRAREFLSALPSAGEVLVLSATFEAGAEVTRSLGRALFGWRRSTPYRCALELARPRLLELGLTAATPLSLEALWARVAYELGETGLLHRLSPLEGKPGLSRALARTVAELRLLELSPDAVEPALGHAMRQFDAALAAAKLADRAQVYALARAAAVTLPRAPLVLLDVPAAPGLERRFFEALVEASTDTLAVAPLDDEQTVEVLSAVVAAPRVLEVPQGTALAELQRNLFTEGHPQTANTLDDFFSAPGEARECVEVARRITALAKAGVRHDDVAVLLRSPGTYRAPLEEAFRRAGIKAWFSSGLPRPDPAGRALLALLRCAEEGLSARRFSEYLSLAQVPKPDAEGAPPAAVARPFSRPDAADTLLPLSPLPPPPAPPPEAVTDVEAPSLLGQLRAPRRWEKLIVEAAVIGGTDRWRRRLSGLHHQLARELENPNATEGQLGHTRRSLRDLEALEQFALPLLDALSALPARATWGAWLEALMSLATRALKEPGRVLAVLHELSPMGPVGPLELPEVRAVLSRRLAEVTESPEGKRPGCVFVAPVDGARGLSFHTVFVPGLAERVFPQKIREDPLLPDRARAPLTPQLEVATNRVAAERLALMLAVGAARERAILSYPRIDAEHARPRVPSFYALEAARAVQGTLPGYEALQRQAEASASVRLAWPAPARRESAIDDTEYDLATIDGILRDDGAVRGRGRYLVTTNAHLGRALRARFARWQTSAWTPHDGLVKPGALGREALAAHHPTQRPFSPTSLEQYAACPYRFFLSALVRLQPYEIPTELEELGPLEKGSMAHEVQFKLLSALRDDGVEVTDATLPEVLTRLHATITRVAAEVYDRFKPAIERVWQDGVQTLEADLRQWLRLVKDDPAWRPAHFELGFGLSRKHADEQDPASSPDPVTLVEGLRVRGSIDLVERRSDGTLRATDYKTGRVKAEEDAIIGGGRHLQPVLYALVLEQLFKGAPVWGGRLFYMTQVGGFTERPVLLDAVTRQAFGFVARTIRGALETGFFPAAPAQGECTWCQFLAVCGPDEERRVQAARKHLKPEVAELRRLREQP
ncbi:MAG: PD-(D/E)XK nuclease family protein [Myxococcus sp.]|nr:PD-(D/E)XK nuclease family protein [Myxococcus sp.]